MVRVEGEAAKVNLFKVPGGYAMPVTFGGDAERVQVVVKKIDEAMGVNPLYAYHPSVVEGTRLLISQVGSRSFPSSHAANWGSMAFLFSWIFPRGKWIYITLAFLVGYSRIYVGVHYPLDVLGGFILGVLCAVLVLYIEAGLSRAWKKHRAGMEKET